MTQRSAVMALVGLALTLAYGLSEEIRWRFDYNAARRDAAHHGKLILLDIGTEQCFWCKKLDAVTFRDPTVIRLLEGRFIPIKVDANREPRLVSALHVQSYPTLLVAAPDGRILERHEGFVGPTEMKRLLDSALTKAPPTGTASSEAASTVSPSAPDASRTNPLNLRSEEARRLLATARTELASGCLLSCLERCRRLTRDYADLPEAEAARTLQRQIAGQSDLARKAQGELTAQLCDLYWERAAELLRTNRPQEAVELLDLLIHLDPESPRAQAARLELLRVQKRLADASASRSGDAVRGQSP